MSELRWHPLFESGYRLPMCGKTGRSCRKTGVRFARVPARFRTITMSACIPTISRPSPPIILPFSDKPGIFATTGAAALATSSSTHPDHNLVPSALSANTGPNSWICGRDRSVQLFTNPDIAQHFTLREYRRSRLVSPCRIRTARFILFPFLPPLVQRELDSARATLRTRSRVPVPAACSRGIEGWSAVL